MSFLIEDELLRKLNQYIEDHNIQQKKVAEDLGVTQTTVCRWLTGERGITKRHKMKVMEYIKNAPINIKKSMPVNLKAWPLAPTFAQKVLDYYSKSNNRVKLFKLLAAIEQEEQDNSNNWDLMG